jgi:hypothetical protein
MFTRKRRLTYQGISFCIQCRGIEQNMFTVRFWIRSLVFSAAIFLLAALLRHTQTQAAGPDAAPAATKKSVVVELFTSEGCSSCPPADELLSHLRQEPNANGAEVIPLGFHVDYWDSPSWHDRFSSAAYSRRQEDYAHRFRIEGPYTPQMVVNGEREFVGSNAGQARGAIAESGAEAAAAKVSVSFTGHDNAFVQIESSRPAEVLMALTEDNLMTKVEGGENGGHTLHHSAVVREFRRLGEVKNGRFSATVPLTIKPEWKPKDLRVVVFVQDAGSAKILGAVSRPFASLSRTN